MLDAVSHGHGPSLDALVNNIPSAPKQRPEEINELFDPIFILRKPQRVLRMVEAYVSRKCSSRSECVLRKFLYGNATRRISGRR